MNLRIGIILFTFIYIFSACKSSKQVSQDTTIADTTSIPIDTATVEEQITEQVTLLQDSVELKVYRLLKDTVSIIGVGDMMLGTNFPDPSYLPPDSGKKVLEDVEPILKNADITFGNLEGVLLNEGGDPKHCNNPKLCYLFRSPVHYVNHLKKAGFDVISTANNHAGDFGDPGRKSTMNALDSAELYHAGLISKPYETFTSEGMKYGFAAFAPNTGTLSINDLEGAKMIVQHLDSVSDIVIISFHGGAEGSKYQHVTREREFFYGENRGNVYEFAHALIDAGADVIFGHGPHVTRAIEVYKERFIIYSLGNFATYARFNLRGENGIAPIVKVYTDFEGKFLKGEIIPVIQYAPGGPRPDPKNRAIKTLQELSRKDFPESPVYIDDSGNINYIHQ
ncbi:MAG: CapA family protein [Candidatus Cyclobacteriaceae bacterium M2_1C_046]